MLQNDKDMRRERYTDEAACGHRLAARWACSSNTWHSSSADKSPLVHLKHQTDYKRWSKQSRTKISLPSRILDCSDQWLSGLPSIPLSLLRSSYLNPLQLGTMTCRCLELQLQGHKSRSSHLVCPGDLQAAPDSRPSVDSRTTFWVGSVEDRG